MLYMPLVNEGIKTDFHETAVLFNCSDMSMTFP